jgi:hypothetical protein
MNPSVHLQLECWNSGIVEYWVIKTDTLAVAFSGLTVRLLKNKGAMALKGDEAPWVRVIRT